MTKIKINLLPIDILEKEFTISLKGYDAKEVDFFLDLIKKDYENWALLLKEKTQLIAKLTADNQHLINNNETLLNHFNQLKIELNQLENKGLSNMELLKRINSLEEKSKPKK